MIHLETYPESHKEDLPKFGSEGEIIHTIQSWRRKLLELDPYYGSVSAVSQSYQHVSLKVSFKECKSDRLCLYSGKAQWKFLKNKMSLGMSRFTLCPGNSGASKTERSAGAINLQTEFTKFKHSPRSNLWRQCPKFSSPTNLLEVLHMGRDVSRKSRKTSLFVGPGALLSITVTIRSSSQTGK